MLASPHNTSLWGMKSGCSIVGQWIYTKYEYGILRVNNCQFHQSILSSPRQKI
jgi:hypothetical protein